MKISILTATYNRAHLLPNLYQSLVQNHATYQDFEWLIMDDGSIDETEELVKKWQKEGLLDIHYYRQKNGGKMSAINHLQKYVHGDIWMEVDSDDQIINGSLAKIAKDYETLEDDVHGILYYTKIDGVDIEKDAKLHHKVMRLYDFHYKYGHTYDTALTFKTAVRKNFVYELEQGEKFITEARTYYKIDLVDRGLLICNKDIIHARYEEDGYSKNIREQFKKYPYGYLKYFQELLNYPDQDILFRKRLYMIKHYILFGYLTHTTFEEMMNKVHGFNKFLVILLYLPGKCKSRLQFGRR